jgi:hypothetical protein
MKWVEAKALTNNIMVAIDRFIYEHIIIRFNCLLELINDQRCSNLSLGLTTKARAFEGAS